MSKAQYEVVNTNGRMVKQFRNLISAIKFARCYSCYARIWNRSTGSWVRF